MITVHYDNGCGDSISVSMDDIKHVSIANARMKQLAKFPEEWHISEINHDGYALDWDLNGNIVYEDEDDVHS